MKTFSTRIDIAPEKRASVIGLCNQQLADTLDLQSQVKQAHWNVKGPNFIALHELFDTFAGELAAAADDLAERVTALGGVPEGTARLSAARSRLPEYPLELAAGKDHVAALADRYAALAKSTRAAIDTATNLGDAATADLFTEVVRGLDKNLWFLEAHLQSSY